MSRYIRYGLIGIALVLTLSCLSQVSVASEATKHYKEGKDLYKKGWYDQAIREFEKAIELKRDYVAAHYALGNSFYCKHLYDKAVKEYHKVLRYDPDHVKAHYALWLSYRALGMTGDADRELEIYNKLSGKSGGKKSASSSHSSTSSSKGLASSEEKTTSWHVADSKPKTPPRSTSRSDTKKHSGSLSHSERPSQFEQKKKESSHSTASSHTGSSHTTTADHGRASSHAAPAHTTATEHGTASHAAPSHTTAAEHGTASHTAPSHTTAAEHGTASHAAPSHTTAAEHGTASHAAPTHKTAADHGDAPHAAPTHKTAADHGHAAPHATPEHRTAAADYGHAPSSYSPVETKLPKIEVHASGHTSTSHETSGGGPHFAVEKPRWHLAGPGIKAKVAHVWKYFPMGKVIVSTVIYIFAAQVWIGVVAMLGLFFWKKRQ